MRTTVAPLALKAQRVDVGAAKMGAACRDAVAEMRCDMRSLALLRRWCFITCVLHTYLNDADLRNTWAALMISHLGRAFPRLAACLRSLIWSQKMAACVCHWRCLLRAT